MGQAQTFYLVKYKELPEFLEDHFGGKQAAKTFVCQSTLEATPCATRLFGLCGKAATYAEDLIRARQPDSSTLDLAGVARPGISPNSSIVWTCFLLPRTDYYNLMEEVTFEGPGLQIVALFGSMSGKSAPKLLKVWLLGVANVSGKQTVSTCFFCWVSST